MKFIVYDFEVYKYDTLLGCLVIDADKDEKYFYQTWNLDEIKDYYNNHLDCLWVGHNNIAYDNGIFDAILTNVNPYKRSKAIINNSGFRKKYYLKAFMYDVAALKLFSLKASELSAGKNIHTTDVDFDIDRPLTDEEKVLVEEYNKDDLRQTLFNLKDTLPKLSLRIDLLNEFKLSKDSINYTEAKIAATVLNAKNITGIENMYVKPVVYDTLQIKNQDVINFYLTEGFRHNKNIEIMLCGCKHKLGSGGIHAALNKVYEPKIMYFDVSGYYNLVMINYDLLPRTIPEEGKQLYIDMYHQQLALKKTNPRKRNAFKTILLAVFGAMMNEYTSFYDPQRGSLVTITGQLFLIDLLEKLEGIGYVVQSNTDGVMFVPFDWKDEEKVWDIVREWEARTGFVIKKEIKYHLYQRDVNNYCFSTIDDVSELIQCQEKRKDFNVCRGEAVGNYWQTINNSTRGQFYDMKEPKIITDGIVDMLLYGISPEETVDIHKNDLRFFQYCCKKLSYDYCVYETTDLQTNIVNTKKIAGINRAFAYKSDVEAGMIYKYKNRDGKLSKTKIACLPPSVFIYNDDILSDETICKLQDKIDWQYYVDRIYERVLEFIDIEQVKMIL